MDKVIELIQKASAVAGAFGKIAGRLVDLLKESKTEFDNLKKSFKQNKISDNEKEKNLL